MNFDLSNIILNDKKVHEYRIKFAYEPSSDDIEKIKQVLEKYDLIKTHELKRTIFQSKPLDFYNLDCGEIWMVDIELNRGLQDDIVISEIANRLKVPKSVLLITNKNFPSPMYAADIDDVVFDNEYDEKYTTKLTDKDYSDYLNKPDVYGDDFVDAVVDKAVQSYKKDRTPYSNYMIAGFEDFYKTEKSDAAPSKPTKGE